MVKEDTVPREVTATAWVNDAPAKALLNVCTNSHSKTAVSIHLDVFPFSAFSSLVLCSRRNNMDTHQQSCSEDRDGCEGRRAGDLLQTEEVIHLCLPF